MSPTLIRIDAMHVQFTQLFLRLGVCASPLPVPGGQSHHKENRDVAAGESGAEQSQGESPPIHQSRRCLGSSFGRINPFPNLILEAGRYGRGNLPFVQQLAEGNITFSGLFRIHRPRRQVLQGATPLWRFNRWFNINLISYSGYASRREIPR